MHLLVWIVIGASTAMHVENKDQSWRTSRSVPTQGIKGEERSFSPSKPYQARPAVNLQGLANEISAVAADTKSAGLRSALEAIAADVLLGDHVAHYLMSLASTFRNSPQAPSLRSLAQDARVLEDQR
jgi:hypothetical protein